MRGSDSMYTIYRAYLELVTITQPELALDSCPPFTGGGVKMKRAGREGWGTVVSRRVV